VWAAALSSSRTYDVILLEIYVGDPPYVREGWALLPQTLQAEILARVQSGTGLLTIRRGNPGGPNAETAVLEGLLPMGLVSTSDYNGPCYPRTTARFAVSRGRSCRLPGLSTSTRHGLAQRSWWKSHPTRAIQPYECRCWRGPNTELAECST